MRPRRPSARSTQTPETRGPRLTDEGLRLGDRTLPLFVGSVQYFRIGRANWRRALEAVSDMGLRMIETYVPWGVHERAEGDFDFGEHDPRLDLGAFLDLAAELDLLVFLRPGPHVNAELPLFGLPERVVFDERNQARSPRGNPLPLPAPPCFFPVPSYASTNFRAQTRAWFQVLGERFSDRCWPNGPLALLQVDNEAAFYFRDGPYDADYHPEAIERFRGFLAERHGTIAALNAAWSSEHRSFDEVDAPRRPRVRERKELPARLDWVAFQEALVCDALAEMREDLYACGFGRLPTVHNLPMGDTGLATSLRATGETVDLVGFDYYHGRGGLEIVRRKTLRLAGNTLLPFAPELGVGAPPWFGPRPNRDALYSTLCACAFGLRAFNLYMTVDRDRWYGAPIANNGEPARSAPQWTRLLAALDECGLHRLKRRPAVAISLPREYSRITRAMHMLGAISPSALDVAGLPPSSACRDDALGFEEPIQLAWTKLVWRLDRALCELQIPFTYVEGDTDLEARTELQLVFAPTYETASPARIDALRCFEQRGGTVVWGPQLPSLDEALRPCDFGRPGRAAPMRLVDQPTTEDFVRAIADELGIERPFPVSPRPMLSTVHEDDRGPRVLFLINPGRDDLRAEVQLPQALSTRDAMTDEAFVGKSLRVPMAKQSCRMLLIEPAARSAAVRRGPSARARRAR